MFTLLDSQALFGDHIAGAEQVSIAIPSYSFIIPLRGDEQLALASSDAPRAIEIYADEIGPPSGPKASSQVWRAIVRGEHQEEMALLNLELIFNAAMQGADRRRRRF
jgi:hypothetical protein